jgi:hypothetical protein
VTVDDESAVAVHVPVSYQCRVAGPESVTDTDVPPSNFSMRSQEERLSAVRKSMQVPAKRRVFISILLSKAGFACKAENTPLGKEMMQDPISYSIAYYPKNCLG